MEDQFDKDMEYHHGEGYESERARSNAGVLEEGDAAGHGGDHAGGAPRERLNQAGGSRDNEAPRVKNAVSAKPSKTRICLYFVTSPINCEALL